MRMFRIAAQFKTITAWFAYSITGITYNVFTEQLNYVENVIKH